MNRTVYSSTALLKVNPFEKPKASSSYWMFCFAALV